MALVIGFSAKDIVFVEASSNDLNVDYDDNSAQEIHDALSQESNGMQFDIITIVDGDEVVASYNAAEGDFSLEQDESYEDYDDADDDDDDEDDDE